MDYSSLLEKKNILEQKKNIIDKVTISSYEKDFELEFTHNSTAIEGNTLTLMETKVILEDGISVGGKELREIYEIVNHRKAYRYVKGCIAGGRQLDGSIVKEIHALLMENIITGGIYRNQEARISGAAHIPPAGNDMYIQIKNFLLICHIKTLILLKWQRGAMQSLSVYIRLLMAMEGHQGLL